jgi:hypothetical protein
VIALHADGTFTDVVYFASEAAARAGEAATEDAPADVAAMLDNLMSAIAIDEYLDLRDPMLH